jgi:DNA-binding transcriptional ArsR family regulator
MVEPKGLADVRLADKVFGALAHPARRQILLSVYYRGTCNAGDIANRFECSWPTTSRHLSTLVASGLLDVRKSGRERVYSVNAAMIRRVFAQWAGYFTTVARRGRTSRRATTA